MVTTKHAWIGFVVLLLVMLLVVVAMLYWQHVTGVNTWHSFYILTALQVVSISCACTSS